MNTKMKTKPREKTFASVDQLVYGWTESVKETVEKFGDVIGDDDVEPIENESRSGFIPFTAGGYQASMMADLSYAESYGCVPSLYAEWLASLHRQADENWDEQHPDDKVENLPESSDIREEYWQYRDEYINGAHYYYKVRAMYFDHTSITKPETPGAEILFCVGICDDEYGRDNVSWLRCYGAEPQRTKWLWERTVKVKDVTEKLLDTLAEEAKAAFKNI